MRNTSWHSFRLSFSHAAEAVRVRVFTVSQGTWLKICSWRLRIKRWHGRRYLCSLEITTSNELKHAVQNILIPSAGEHEVHEKQAMMFLLMC